MATVTLNASSTAFPTITNRTRAELYKVSDPTALYASIIDTTSGHPARSWQFVGLDRTNYYFQITEIDGSGNILNVLSEPMSVVPSMLEGLQFRTPEQITVGVTTGLTVGATSATFDGTAGAPDYRGWEIRPCVIGGQNYMIKGVDYSYNIATGLFSLLQAGDVFAPAQVYNIQFDDRINPTADSTPTTFDLTVQLITSNTTLTAGDIGKQLIVEPSGTYLEITLPDISTVVSGRCTPIEVTRNEGVTCVKLVPHSGDTINFLNGNVYIYPNESVTLYKFTRSAGVYEWRIKNAVGNFVTVGQMIYSDAENSYAFNLVEAAGNSLDAFEYSRLYFDFVNNLPASQVCNYDDWATGVNRYKFSYANSANPTYANQFHIPDRQAMILKAKDSTRAVGSYEADGVGVHDHVMHGKGAITGTITSYLGRTGLTYKFAGGGGETIGNRATTVDTTLRTGDTGNTETTVKNISSRLYILI